MVTHKDVRGSDTEWVSLVSAYCFRKESLGILLLFSHYLPSATTIANTLLFVK